MGEKSTNLDENVLTSTEININSEYPLLIKNLGGIISEDDLKKLSKKDEKTRNILRNH